MVVAGDIACPVGTPPAATNCQAAATAAAIESMKPAAVLALGDLQYERGELDGFRQSYAASWGSFKAITHPAAGNHEYGTGRAPGYYAYWGAAAGPADRGWYSFDTGGWHVVALNSNCALVGGCGDGSPEATFLAADLAAHPAACTLAFWHHPYRSSGLHGSDDSYATFWRILSAAGADVVLSGHDHDYERFAPLDGIREFVVGTGGRSLYPHGPPLPGSESVSSAGFGVLELTLRANSYSWRFVPVAGNAFRDSGSGSCQ